MLFRSKDRERVFKAMNIVMGSLQNHVIKEIENFPTICEAK